MASQAQAMTAEDYDKLSQREHILLRPGMYIGSTAPEETEEWVYNRSSKQVEKRTLSLPEAVKRCFYEAISNASDAVIRSRERGFDPKEIVVTMNDTMISITNYGCPIPVVKHEKEGKWVPEMIFSDFLSSSNYNPKKVRSGIGLNGLGIKLVSVFSKAFTVDLDDHVNRLSYTQTFRDNLLNIDAPIIKPFKGASSRVEIKYTLDFGYFSLNGYTEDDKDLFARFAMDYSLSCSVATRFNDLSFPVQTLSSMASLYFGEAALSNAITYAGKVDVTVQGTDVHGRKSPAKLHRMQTPVEFCLMDTPFEGQVIAFVNGMMVCAGVHIDSLYKSIADKVLPSINQDLNGKPMLSAKDLKQHTSLLMVCTLPDPAFKSQVKSQLASPEPTFSLPATLFAPLKKWELMDRLKNILEQKETTQLAKTDGKKRRHISVPGYTTCNWAGGPKSSQCTLCLTEGNSAETYGVKGRARVEGGIDKLGLYRLRGKLLNVMNAKLADVAKNREVQGLKEVLGLREGVDYADDENYKRLRYGKVRIMTDADNDGKHIACLIINYFHFFYPSLVARGYLEILLTPIIRVWKGNDDRHKAKHRHTFYTSSEFLAWKTKTSDWRNWKVKYYKGLATSVDKDIDEDYKSLHTLQVSTDIDTPDRLRMAFNDQLAYQRKAWMQQWTPELEVPALPTVSVTTYIDRALIHYSVVSVQRNIPAFQDGLKEGQRKVIAAALRKWPHGSGGEIKVAQLASYTSENFNYHYGEAALQETITAMAQDFVGANNLRFFEQHGQFGTRIKGGKDAGSPRYIFVKPERWLQEVFRPEDDILLNYIEDEGSTQEPEFYLPIVPMWAINGALGIATGYSTFIPNHNPMDVCAWLEVKLKGAPLPTLKPWYRGFKGKLSIKMNKKKPVAIVAPPPAEGSLVPPATETALHDDEDLGNETLDDAGDNEEVSLVTEGAYTAELHKGIHITELPIGRWTEGYMKWLDDLLDPKCKCTKGTPNYGMPTDSVATCCSACKVVGMVTKEKVKPLISEKRLCSAEPEHVDIFVAGFSNPSNKALRLRKSLGLTNMVLLNEGRLPTKCDSVTTWLERFYSWRLPYYGRRKESLLRTIKASLQEAEEKRTFVAAVVSGTLVVVKQSKEQVVERCKELKLQPRYLSLPITQLTQDDITELEKKVQSLTEQYAVLAARSPEDLWVSDLQSFVNVYKKTIGTNVKKE
jgi:DNA topoisomerase-2